MSTERGVGDLNWVQDYVGLPYLAGGRGPAWDCWGLVVEVYKNELGVQLPDWVIDPEIMEGNWEVELPEPTHLCLVRTPRGDNVPDHYGIYIGGGVLSASPGGSVFVDLRRYLERNAGATFVAFKVSEELVQ